MSETSVMIIHIKSEAHLKWILEMQTACYKKRQPQELNLFHNEESILSETSVSDIVFVYRHKDVLKYLTCLSVREDAAPISANEDDLEMLSYPFDENGRCANTSYLLVDVDTSSPTKPSLCIDDERLIAFMKERYITDACSVFPTKELLSEGVIKDGEGAEIPDTSYNYLNEVQKIVNQDERQRHSPQKENQEKYSNVRAAKERLRVTFPDGTVLCDRSAAITFSQTIEKIGAERVAALNLEYCKTPLLSHEYSTNKPYKAAQREISGGWLLFTQGSSTTKQLLLLNISKRLNLGLKIEKSADLAPITKEKAASKKVAKNSLLVTLSDGTFIAGDSSRDTYVKTLRHIGLDKVRRLSADIAGVPLITTQPVAKATQSDEHNGLYITIPNGTKKMYKYLMLIASFTHTKITVTII